MRTIAMIGGGPSKEASAGLKTRNPDIEIWTLNRLVLELAVPYEVIDRLYEIHPAYYILNPWYPWAGPYGNWLSQKHPFPIFVMDEIDQIPSGIEYPIRDVVKACFPDSWRGNKRVRYITTSFAMMLGHAILEHKQGKTIDRIEMYGFDMAANYEYAYQKPGAHRLLGHIEGLGIQTWTPLSCTNFDAKLYGYEVSEMIPRQTFEEYRRFYMMRMEQIKAELNQIESLGREVKTQMDKAEMNGASKDDIDDLHDRVQELSERHLKAQINLGKYDSAIQVCNKFIDMCDLQQPPKEFISTVGRIPFDDYVEYEDPVPIYPEEMAQNARDTGTSP